MQNWGGRGSSCCWQRHLGKRDGLSRVACAAEALAVAEKHGERRYEAEVYRLEGELLLALSTGGEAEAEACSPQARDLAHSQQAKLLERRAAMSLS